MNYSVVSVTNRIPDSSEPYYDYPSFMKSLQRFEVEPIILGMSAPWSGLLTKPRTLQRWLKSGQCNAECLLVVDTFDLIFLAHPSQIVDYWKCMGKTFIMGTERDLFPKDLSESDFPKCASSYRFPNSGFIIASPEQMLHVLEAMDLPNLKDDYQNADMSWHHGNDQLEYQRVFLNQPVEMRLDTECRFVWNLCNVGRDEIELLPDGRIKNKETDSLPMVAHFNGGSKGTEPDGVKAKIYQHLKLP